MGVKMRRISIITACLLLVLFASTIAFAEEQKPKVIFDQAHGERFSIEDNGILQLSKLATIFRKSGLEVISSKEPITDESLKGASGLFISGLFNPLQPEEVEAIMRFLERGGNLAVTMHIAPPLSNLIFRFGLGLSQTVLHERQNIIDEDINFRVTDLSPSPLFAGIKSFSAYGVWAIDPNNKAQSAARTSSEAWMDVFNTKVFQQGDPVGHFSVIVTGKVGKGEYMISGDDAIFQNKFLDENNSIFARNLALWLTARHI